MYPRSLLSYKIANGLYIITTATLTVHFVQRDFFEPMLNLFTRRTESEKYSTRPIDSCS